MYFLYDLILLNLTDVVSKAICSRTFHTIGQGGEGFATAVVLIIIGQR